MTYTIWLCCENFEQEETREAAISYAAALMDGDGHTPWAVEGPDGEDLMGEAEELNRRRSDEWIQRSKEIRAQLLGHIEVKGPTGKWSGREAVYTPRSPDSELAEHAAVYGADRVRWVPKT